MNKLMQSSVVGILSLASFAMPGCGRAETEAVKPDAPTRLAKVEDFGNGVYKFPADDYFLQTLSDFKGKHPELRVTSVSQGTDFRSGYGNSAIGYAGYMVVVTDANGAAPVKAPAR